MENVLIKEKCGGASLVQCPACSLILSGNLCGHNKNNK